MPPVAGTAARLSALDPYAGFDAVTGDGGWVGLGVAERDGHLDAWFAALLALHGKRAVAGSLLGAELARVVAGPGVSAIVLEERCPDPVVENLAVTVETDGLLGRSGVRGMAMAVLAEDPAASDPDCVVLADEAELDQWWAWRAAVTLTPLLRAVRARAPFGLPGLWGGVADEVTGTALWIAQMAGLDPYVAWSRGQRLLDALAVHAPVAPARAVPFPVSHSGGFELFQVRGTCCLYYRSAAAIADGPAGDRYCNTCPLRDDDSRQSRLRDTLPTASSAQLKET